MYSHPPHEGSIVLALITDKESWTLPTDKRPVDSIEKPFIQYRLFVFWSDGIKNSSARELRHLR